MILADHCVFATTIRRLQEAGYRITRLKELASPEASDAEVLRLAIERDWVLLTNDNDFGNVLLYPPARHEGIIVLRIRPQAEDEVHRVLLQLLSDRGREGLRHVLAVVSPDKYRIRV